MHQNKGSYMGKTYQVIFSREIVDNRVTVECTIKAKTFGEAEHLACKKISSVEIILK